MGNWNVSEAKILMVGLDAAGKTTILYKLKVNEVVQTIPTVGFNVESVKFQNKIQFTVWDIGGQDNIRRLWRYYYSGVKGLVFVIDSNDRERIDEAVEELQKLLREDELRDASLLVLANKQDLPQALSVAELGRKLKLDSVRDRKWYVQATQANTGMGLDEGFSWLAKNVDGAKKKSFWFW